MDIIERLHGEQLLQQQNIGCGLEVLDEAADEITRLRDDLAIERLSSSKLRQQVQELQQESLAYAKNLRGKHDLAGATYTMLADQLAASQAREAKLRESLTYAVNHLPLYTAEAALMLSGSTLGEADDTALKEYRKRVLLEAADKFDADEWDTAADRLRRMAEEA